MTALYPTGYGTSLVTLEQLHERHTAHHMEPEYARRLFAWLEAQGGLIGIGGSWRTTPAGTSAASRAGHSFHQSQRWADGSHWFAAVDLVARASGPARHRAPTWDEVPVQGSAEAAAWHLHANVRGEPWHLQPVEVDGWASWARAGRHRPRGGVSLPRTVELMPAPSAVPSHLGHPRPTLRPGSLGGDVPALQVALRHWHDELPHHISDCGRADGRYGPRTEAAVRDWQQHVGRVLADGVYGPHTAEAWQRVADYLEAQH